MKKRNNSAARVHAILVRAKGISPGQNEPSTGLDIWARVLKVTAKEHYARERKVTTALALLQSEVEHIDGAMQASEDAPDPELYRIALARAREIFSVQTLPHAWSQNVAPRITTEVIQAIGWCAREMQDDGETLTEQQVDELLSEVRELIDLFESSAVRPALKTFIVQQLRLVEQALINYAVVGGRPLVETFVRVRRDISERRAEIIEADSAADSESRPAVWEKLESYGNKLYSALSGLVRFGKLLREGYDTVKGFLPAPGGPE